MDPILGMLSTKEPISGERLCEQLGMTRAAVWKRMEKLRAEGYRIVSAGKLGYRLDPEENSLLPGMCFCIIKYCQTQHHHHCQLKH